MTIKKSFRPRAGRAARVLGVLVAFAAVAGIAVPAHAPERGPVRRAAAVASAAPQTEARVIVKFRADSTLMRAQSAGTGATVVAQHAGALSARLGLSLADGRAIGARAQVVRGPGLGSQALADRLAAESDVEYAVVDRPMQALAAPNDPLYPAGQTAHLPAAGQWYLRAPTGSTIVDATSVVASINAEAAWAITTGSSGVVVAVLDTGVRRDHPDLAPKLLAGYDFITDTSLSNDGDGRDADAADPGDYTSTESSSWHGTQTAGMVGAATNNGLGMASVGRDVTVLPVRVLGKGGTGYSSDIQAAMLWAAGLSSTPVANPNPAKVINLSLGGSGGCGSDYLDVVRQLNAANVVVVAAAGNEGLAVGTPANCTGVIGVAGVRHAGTKVGYSDLGAAIAIAAPAGNCVNASGTCLYPLLTTSNSGTTTPVSNANGGSIYTGGGSDASLGTSFSSPLVAGTVGLMMSVNPTLTPSQVLLALRSTARAFPSSGAGAGIPTCTAPTATAQNTECYCTTSTCGAGLTDTGSAVDAVARPAANVSASADTVTAGTSVTFDGTGSWSGGRGATLASYRWTIVSSSANVAFVGSSTAPTMTLSTAGSGGAIVALTVTDTAGQSATTNASLTINAAPSSGGGGGGGGGALGWGWLAGWLVAVGAVQAVRSPAWGPRKR